MKVLTGPPLVPDVDPAEALIREAHRRKRRRRRLVVGGVAIAVLGAGGYVLSGPGGVPPRPRAHAAAKLRGPGHPEPVVDAAAFAHQGHLAFVSQGTLWVLDGTSLHRVRTDGLVPSSPSLSPDGKWLAFVASREVVKEYADKALGTYTEVLSTGLWFARADGTDARPARRLAVDKAFGWDPGRDLFAVSVGKSTTVPYGVATGVDLVSPAGTVRTLVQGSYVTSAVWSPTGSALAVSTEAPSTGAGASYGAVLAAYPVDGAPPTVWLRSDTRAANFVVPAGWWPTWGIGYTTVGEGAVPGGSGSADGSPFSTVAAPGATPQLLGRTLQSEGAGAPVGTSTGWLAYVSEYGHSGRTVGQGEEVMACSPLTTACTAVPHPATTVTVDPAWTPDGTTLSYAQGPQSSGYLAPLDVEQWYDARQLYAYDPATGAVQPGVPSPGATAPRWSSDGKRLLYVSDDGLWLHASRSAPAVEIAHPLFPPDLWPSYYGQVAFSSQFSWWSGPGPSQGQRPTAGERASPGPR